MSVNKTALCATISLFVTVSGTTLAGNAWAADLVDPAQTTTTSDGAPGGSVEDIWTRDKLTGDWGGLRTDLAKYGIDIDLRLSQYYQGVASGGVNTNGEYGGTMDYRINVDAHKLGLWEGLAFNIHARSRFGEDINADAGALVLPNAGMLMPAPGNYQGTDVTGLTVSQTFPFVGGLLGNITVGKLDVIDLVTGFFPRASYGQEGFMNTNALASALPWFGAVQGLSLYGVMAVTINTKYQAAESGFVAAGTEGVSTSWGSLSDSFDDGVFLAGFHRFFWDMDNKMGYFMIFVGGSTKKQASNDPNDFVDLPGQGIASTNSKAPWDIALYIYQDLWQAVGNPNRKVSLTLGGTLGPDNPQFAQWNAFGALEAFGLYESRPHDRMGVAVWWNGLSDQFTELVSPVLSLRDTWGAEVYYNFQVTPWAHVSADLQLVQNQNKGDDFAVIPGVRFVADF
jgi:porin